MTINFHSMRIATIQSIWKMVARNVIIIWNVSILVMMIILFMTLKITLSSMDALICVIQDI